MPFTAKEVEGTITAEEALRCTYKLIFKQDLEEIREWGLFTEREGLMQMGRYHFQILWTLPFQFLQDFLTKQHEAKWKLWGVTYVELIILISFWCTVKETYLKKILNKPIDLIRNLSQEITCRYHANKDFTVSMASNQNTQFKNIFICNPNYKA